MARTLPWRSDVLTGLSNRELLRLKTALEGSEGSPVDSGIYNAVLCLVWDRMGVAVAKWPTRKTASGLRLIDFCIKAHTPEDPEHRPTRRIRRRYRGALPEDGWRDDWYECSCGVQDGRPSAMNATGRTWRVAGTPGGWLPSDAGMYLVCPRANDIDDRQHALVSVHPDSFYCICHRSFDTNEAKQIPVEN